MSQKLAITVRLHDGRYHGTGEWRPSPARLFQALVAGASRGAIIDSDSSKALEYLEALRPPTIALPVMRAGQPLETFVPNNDIDAVGADFNSIGDIRSSKSIQPQLFDSKVPFVYVWAPEGGAFEGRHCQQICSLAERIYQFGRGVDMAWAWGEVLDDEEVESRLSNHPGLVSRPSDDGRGKTLACPRPGSLASLKARYVAGSQRFKTEGQGKAARQLFSQPPKPRFVEIAYDCPPSRRVYELRADIPESSLGTWSLVRVTRLVEWLRHAAAARLRSALPDQSTEIERLLVGRKADGTDAAPAFSRVRIVPLPSIGHHHADRGIRRVLVEVPASCPLRTDDVHWAFSGLDLSDPETGEVRNLILTPSADESMLAHYGAADRVRSRVWRTVTPAALPTPAGRRRIEPTRLIAEAKGGAERFVEQARAATAVSQALRHAGVLAHVETIRVQREPFEGKGERVEAFASGTRFTKERLWHVEITFNAPVDGPLIIGDGRFLGLGVMAPVRRNQDTHAFLIKEGLAATFEPTEIARALRRAVMARVPRVLGSRKNLPTFFSGHERDGAPAQTERQPHLTFLFDPGRARLLVLAPHVVDRRAPTRDEVRHMEDLEAAMADFRDLRAGPAGRLVLRASPIDTESDPLFAASRTWESVTPYQVTRHAKQVGADGAFVSDLLAECRRHGLPEPRVTSRELRGVRGIGLVGAAHLTFEVAVKGPIVLGKSRHFGGGLFVAVEPG